jgi:hypothetical protein
MTYQYRSKDETLDFDSAYAKLKQSLEGRNRVFKGHPDKIFTEESTQAIRADLLQRGYEVIDIRIEKQELMDYVAKAKYRERYPTYYVSNLLEKSLEHLIGIQLLALREEDKFVDIANEHSPVPEIFGRLLRVRSYAQDIMFKPGLHGRFIGGDAGEMSRVIPKGFFSGALLSCSLEHFEGGGDIHLFEDITNVLSDRGKIVVVPLYLHHFPFIATDPIFSVNSGTVFDKDIDVYCIEGSNNRHMRFYSPATLYTRVLSTNKNLAFRIFVLSNRGTIDPSVYCRFILVGEKVLDTP